MSAIFGRYAPARKHYHSWAADWIYASDRWSSPRHHLANQLRRIKAEEGRHEAREFRNYLLWLGVYPVRLRKVASK